MDRLVYIQPVDRYIPHDNAARQAPVCGRTEAYTGNSRKRMRHGHRTESHFLGAARSVATPDPDSENVMIGRDERI